jgi:ABC-type transport system involved in cytochrome c biogenesis permease subunit
MKRYLYDLVGGSVVIFVLVQISEDKYRHLLNDRTFVVGVIMLSVGLLTVTGAAKLFRGMGYVLKKLFTRKVEGMSYYDYLLTKEERRQRMLGLPMLLAGLTFIILSLTIADKISQYIY